MSGAMRAVARGQPAPSWYFTAPWEHSSARRGDALGFRALADHYADLLAPGLSNSTVDARWLTLLSWSLHASHQAWAQAGGAEADLLTRAAQQARYAWLRPLELMWVARALQTRQPHLQLRGSRSVQRWLKGGQAQDDFGMGADTLARYRQSGLYGAYRVLLRAADGLATQHGWAAGPAGLALARLVDGSQKPHARLNVQPGTGAVRWQHWSDGRQARYWLAHGWPRWQDAGGLMPTEQLAAQQPLPDPERALLRRALFAPDSVREATAHSLAAAAHSADTHFQMCQHLARSPALGRCLGVQALAGLPAFSCLADAAMRAMRALWAGVHEDPEQPAARLRRLLGDAALQAALQDTAQASRQWLQYPQHRAQPRAEVVTQLAAAMHAAARPVDRLRALVRHHHEHGGGQRWFVLRGAELCPLVGASGVGASDYGFRLVPLASLAAQCAVADMGRALDALRTGHVAGQEDADADGLVATAAWHEAPR